MATFTVFHKDSETGQVSDVEVQATDAAAAIATAIEMAREFGHELQAHELSVEAGAYRR